MFGQVGVIDNPVHKSGFLYSMDFKDRDNKASRWMITPALCTERCRMVSGAKYSIVEMGGSRYNAPYCACAQQNFPYVAAKGYIPSSNKHGHRYMVTNIV